MTSQKQKHYRSHWEIIRVTLRFLKNAAPYAQAQFRIMYNLQCSVDSINNLISEMEYLGLIKVEARECQTTPTVRMYYTITQRGSKVLELLDGQAELLSKSPWINENINQ